MHKECYYNIQILAAILNGSECQDWNILCGTIYLAHREI